MADAQPNSTEAPGDGEPDLPAQLAAAREQVAALREEAEEAVQRERAVGQILQTITRSAFDLQEVLQTVIDHAVELAHADFGNILRHDETTGFYRIAAYAGTIAPGYLDLVSERPYRPERGTLVGRTLAERRPVHIVDILEDPEYAFWESQDVTQFRTILGIPMIREDVIVGVFVVWRVTVNAFTDHEIELLTTLADQAVLAIENVRLFRTVDRQLTELARFAPQVAELLARTEGEDLLAGHRREITALFADLRGFTAFAESAEPEELLGVLRQYHALVGETVVKNGGTLEHFAGDGLMAFFNDPVPLADHQLVAVRTALEIRSGFDELDADWKRRGYELGLGIGAAVGYATLGRIGFSGRYDYGAIGNVIILASRLSDAANGGQILLSQRLYAAVEESVRATPLEEPLHLKGITRPVPAFSVIDG
jgi:class 3 adenylate cyclase